MVMQNVNINQIFNLIIVNCRMFLLILLLASPCVGESLPLGHDVDEYRGSQCSHAMFGGDSFAYWACVTQYALQQNWWPSPIEGLFTYQSWNGFDGFWQNGCLLETMANFNHYSNTSRYRSVLLSSWRSMHDLLNAYFPLPSFDDEGWYGLSYARIYEVTGNSSFLHQAELIYNWTCENGWDATNACRGGFWFDNNFSYKATITNVQMMQLGAKLYRLTNETFYWDRTLATWSYITGNGILDADTYRVSDNIDVHSCVASPTTAITYNSGVLIGTLAEMYKVTGDNAYYELAHKVARVNMKAFSPQAVLMEYCDQDQCASDNGDAKMFKGIFVRNLRYLLDVSPPSQQAPYLAWLRHNVHVVLQHASCHLPIQHCNIHFLNGPSEKPLQGPVFSERWSGPYNHSAPMQQTSVLDLLVASINYATTCTGPGCTFDPPTSNSKHLDCRDNPCPDGWPCCSWQNLYSTCCMPTQSCVDGGCY